MNSPLTIDTSTKASDPGRLLVSRKKLRRLRPDLFGLSGLGKSLIRFIPLLVDELTEIKEHLYYGDSRAALVISVSPLSVAAFSDEMDCVVILRFPKKLAKKYQLSVGSRLLTVNIYSQEGRVQEDLLLGELYLEQYFGFTPIIAEFVSDQIEKIEARKRAIDEEEWQRTEHFARDYVQRFPGVFRDGRPGLSVPMTTIHPTG